MSKHYITLSIFLSIFFVLFIASGFLFAAHAVTVTNFGFIQGNIWYSKDPFYDNDKIRIYTGVFNGSSEDITGTVEFYDNDKVIGRADFSIAAGGKLQEVWTDWIATQGQHKISAKITQAKASRILGGDKEMTLTNNQSGQDNRVIVIDPAVLAAAAASTATASSTATPLPALVNQLLDKTPPAVASGAKTIINGINALAEAAAAKLDKTAAVLRQEIAQAKSSASSSANSTLMAKNAPAKVLPKTAASRRCPAAVALQARASAAPRVSSASASAASQAEKPKAARRPSAGRGSPSPFGERCDNSPIA